MADPKPIASLTSGLLARKGMAQPAMRRPMPGFGRPTTAGADFDDLGWNDMGFDGEPEIGLPDTDAFSIGLTPMATVVPIPPVVLERELLASRMARKVEMASGRKAAFTLRLDADRHLKLRLACAVTGRSAQQIVIQALDDLINDLPDIDRLAVQLLNEG
ncbi:hypothetical protein [Sphingobium sp.]|uniref:hypothetical protein n=1 Tax=Sphingobium sp. TaxID=1912891 RepID=UPI003B3B17D4